MEKREYNREKAVAYAHRWAYGRNPRFYDFEDLEGDCTNFVSQVLYAGGAIMNYTPTFGWYYRNLNDRAPAWTGVEYLYNFLVKNKGVGPYAVETIISKVMPGDVVQIAENDEYSHTVAVVSVGKHPDLSNILIASHSFDSDNRPLDTYEYKKIRFLHIKGINT